MAIFERYTTIGLRISRRRAAEVFIDLTKEHNSLETNSACTIQKKATLSHANIREEKGPSLEKFCSADPYERSPYAPKFEDRSQEQTERQERCARGDAWTSAKSMYRVFRLLGGFFNHLLGGNFKISGFLQVFDEFWSQFSERCFWVFRPIGRFSYQPLRNLNYSCCLVAFCFSPVWGLSPCALCFPYKQLDFAILARRPIIM